MKKIVNLKLLMFEIVIIVLIFQNYLQQYIPFFQHFDEILALLAIPIIILKMIKSRKEKKKNKSNIYLIMLFLIFIIIGLYSSLKFQYQSINIVLSDMLLASKFILTYFLSELVIDIDFIEHNNNRIRKLIKMVIVLFFALTTFNYIFIIWPTNSFRFGIMSNQLFYGHPTYLAAICIFLLSLLLLTSKLKNSIIYITLIFFVLLSTLRFKAIGAAIVIIMLIYYLNKNNKKISISKLGIAAVFLVVLAWDQISYYYIDLDGSARKVLNETAIKIANDYFPVGTGFGTFASYFSSVSYSPIYKIYGISNIYGLQYGNANYVSDVFWPMVIGQFGYIGLFTFIGIILLIVKKVQDDFSIEYKNIYIAKIICLVYIIISSTSESAFVNPIAIPLAIIIGINTMKKNK